MRWIVSILIVLAAAGCAGSPAEPTAESPAANGGVTVLETPIEVADFVLTNQQTQEVHLTDLRGKPVLMVFGYTHCPDVCPVTLARFKQVKTELAEAGDDVQFVFISVDGVRDTPERLAQYLPLFDSSFIGLTGDEDTTHEIIRRYNGEFFIKDAQGLRTENYSVDHTASAFLMDSAGRWVVTFEYNTPPATIAESIRGYLGA